MRIATAHATGGARFTGGSPAVSPACPPRRRRSLPISSPARHARDESKARAHTQTRASSALVRRFGSVPARSGRFLGATMSSAVVASSTTFLVALASSASRGGPRRGRVVGVAAPPALLYDGRAGRLALRAPPPPRPRPRRRDAGVVRRADDGENEAAVERAGEDDDEEEFSSGAWQPPRSRRGGVGKVGWWCRSGRRDRRAREVFSALIRFDVFV